MDRPAPSDPIVDAPRLTRRGALAALAGAILPSLPGCGYTLRPPYDRDIETVYVPIFRSFTFRPEQNIELTRLVQQEITRRTPYRVVDTPDAADTCLSGTVLFTEKFVIVTTPNNYPRNEMGQITAEVTWEDLRREPVEGEVEKPPQKVRVMQMVYFYPELGETSQLGFLHAMERMAKDIVNMMEKAW